MTTVCCDTSFLYAIYGNDKHTPSALSEIEALQRPLTITVLNEFELANALRFAESRKFLAAGKSAAYLADFAADITAGKLIVAMCNLAEILAEAKRLSAIYTLAHGHRAFDILHVAAAIHLNAKCFLTFDTHQSTLAKSSGLKVRP